MAARTTTPGSVRALADGARWVFLGRALVRGADILKLVVLARWLTPADVGVVGVAMFALTCLETVTDPGLNQAVVQRRGDVRRHLDTVFAVQVVRGVLLAAVLGLVAPGLARFFHVGESAAVLQALAAVFVLRGLQNPGMVLYARAVDFRPLFRWSATEAAAGMVVALLGLLVRHDAWVLVWSVLAAQAARTVASWALHPFRPAFTWDGGGLRELLRFGRWVTATNVLIALVVNADAAIVGRLLGPAALGLYQVASQLASFAATQVTQVAGQVTFPWYARLQDDRARLRTAVAFVQSHVALVALPIAAVLAVFAPEVVGLGLGPQWTGAVTPLRILCVFGALRAINGTWGALFQAAGVPQVHARITAAQALLLLAIVPGLALRHGLPGAAVGATVANLLCLGLSARAGLRIVGGGWWSFAAALAPGLLWAAVAVATGTALRAAVGSLDLHAALLLGTYGVLAASLGFAAHRLGWLALPARPSELAR